MIRTHNAEYWMGWMAVATRQPCTYTDAKAKRQWAKGYAAAVAAATGAKPFWKSRTFLVGTTLLGFGIVMWIVGNGGSGMMSSGYGQGVTTSSLLMLFLRTITNEPVTLGSGYYTPPPMSQ